MKTMQYILMEIHYTQILTRDTVYRIKIQPTHTAAPLPLPLPTHNSQPLTLVHDSTLWRTKPPYPFSTTVCYSIPKLKYSHSKIGFYSKQHKSDTNKTIEIVLCHVLLPYECCHQISRLHWFFMCFFYIMPWTNPQVWYSCQGKQYASCQRVKSGI